MTPTARSLAYLRKRGYVACVVERRLPLPGGRHTTTVDAFGFADIIAVHPDERGTLYVQTTGGSNGAARKKKIMASVEALAVLTAGNSIAVHCWKMRLVKTTDPKAKSKTRRSWECVEDGITLDDFKA